MSDHITTINITRRRGDNFPLQFTLKDENGAAIDITGYSFRMVVDTSNAPADATNNLFDLTAVLVTPASGVFQFEPTVGDMNITPETYFYEIEMTDAAGKIRTIVAGTFIVEQDIAK